MHANDTVEVAGVVATQSATLVSDRRPLSASSLSGYWYASRDRLETWVACLSAHRRRAGSVPSTAWTEVDLQLLRVVHDLLATELLTRVWTCVIAGIDTVRNENHLAACHGIFASHRDLAQRALNEPVQRLRRDRGVAASIQQEAEELMRFRSRVERWTDLLVGYLVVGFGDAQFAFAPDRARDFADDIRRHRRMGRAREAWGLTLQSLRLAFQARRLGQSPLADSHRRVASHILACFDPTLVDSVGTLDSLWTTRLMNRADDVNALVGQLRQAV